MWYCAITKAHYAQTLLPWRLLAWCMSVSAGRWLRLQPGKLLRRSLSIS